jgi:hypothetical protein
LREHGGATRDELRRRAWPRSAWFTVIVLSAALMSVFVLWLTDSRLFIGQYRAEHSGTVADWFSAVGALLAVPLALLIANRVRADERRSFVAEEEERSTRRERDRQVMRESLEAELRLMSVVEADDDGNDIDPDLAAVWRAEMTTRGWRHDATTGMWTRNGDACSTRELVNLEPTDLVKQPWTVLAVCRNHGATTVRLKQFVVEMNGGPRAVELSRTELTPRSAACACVLTSSGHPVRYKTADSASRAVRSARALFGDDGGRDIHVEANLRGGR